jgi:hypothetical protein
MLLGRKPRRWRVTCFREIARDGCHAEPLLARRVLVVRDELNESSRAWLKGLSGRGDDFKVDSGGGPWRDRVEFPSRSLTDTDLRLSDARTLLS